MNLRVGGQDAPLEDMIGFKTYLLLKDRVSAVDHKMTSSQEELSGRCSIEDYGIRFRVEGQVRNVNPNYKCRSPFWDTNDQYWV